MMERCANCKHWTARAPDHIAWQREYGDLERGEPHERGLCRRITMIGDRARPVPLTDLAHVEDGSRFLAELHTKAEFGCVLFEFSINPKTGES